MLIRAACTPVAPHAQVCFIDLDTGGEEGKVFYSAFTNPRAQWPIQERVGQPALQLHDTYMVNLCYKQLKYMARDSVRRKQAAARYGRRG